MFGPAAPALGRFWKPERSFSLLAGVRAASADWNNSWNNLFICNDLRAVAMAAEFVQHQTSDFFILEHQNSNTSVILHKYLSFWVDVCSKQLLLTADLRKAHLKPFKSEAVTVSTLRYRHSSMASASSLSRGAQRKAGTQQQKYASLPSRNGRNKGGGGDSSTIAEFL